MAVEIKTEHIDVAGKGVLLVAVRGGAYIIGTCSAGHNIRRNDGSMTTRLFYIGNEPVVEFDCPNHGDKRTDKLVSLCTGYAGMEQEIQDAFTEAFNKVNKGESLENGLRDIFAMLSDGVYTVYTSEYYPTDGSGTYFWGAYNIPHEVHGTAQHNRVIGKEKVYRPCFLIPGNPLDSYIAKTLYYTDEAVKSRRIQGIVYHVSGLHSILLKGHHGSVSCVMADTPFKCAVIEKINDTYTEPIMKITQPGMPMEEPAEGEEMAAEEKPLPEEEVVFEQPEGITGFRSASVKIPLEYMPKDMIQILLENRSEIKPEQYNLLVKRSGVVKRKAVSNNVVPRPVLEKCDLMPDCEMIESAFAVSSLSQAQLDALLSGSTDLDGEIIISTNFYSSIVTACNYLQFHNEQKFIDFALAIMENPELNATHEYIARRVSRVHNKRVYSFFRAALADGGEKYEKILHSAERYIRFYEMTSAE